MLLLNFAGMKSFFNKPYPFIDNSLKPNIIKAVLIGVFVVLFLWLFDNAAKESILAIADNGLVIAICQFGLLFLAPKFLLKKFSFNKLRVWQYILWLIIYVIISFYVLFIYTNLVYWRDKFSIPLALCYTKNNIAFIFPILIFVVCIDYIWILRKELSISGGISEQLAEQRNKIKPLDHQKKITHDEFDFCDEQQKSVLKVPKSAILFVKGADNYVENYYISENKLAKLLIRTKLNTLETDKKNDFLNRVHRSYLCNLHKVVKVSGNAQGYLLHFEESEERVPVSRGKSKEVIEKLAEISRN